MIVGLLITSASFNLNTATVFACPTNNACTMAAAPVTLAWDASPDTTVTGYALYYRATDSNITNRLDVGTALTATLYNLGVGSDYLFFVAAYNAASIESLPSNTLLYRPPAMSRLRINEDRNGRVSIRFRAAAGALCRVEYASTLVSPRWRTLGSAVADANGNVQIDDPLSSRAAIRFYRAVREHDDPAAAARAPIWWGSANVTKDSPGARPSEPQRFPVTDTR